MYKLTKKGVLNESKNGQMRLVNDKGEFYKVNKSIVLIWNMLDGKNTSEDIFRNLKKISPIDSKELEIGINKIISQLKKCELAE